MGKEVQLPVYQWKVLLVALQVPAHFLCKIVYAVPLGKVVSNVILSFHWLYNYSIGQ